MLHSDRQCLVPARKAYSHQHLQATIVPIHTSKHKALPIGGGGNRYQKTGILIPIV